MERLFAMLRARDNKRVEFFTEMRNGKKTYIIREIGAASQDSVTTDPDAMQIYRDRLLAEGYMESKL